MTQTAPTQPRAPLSLHTRTLTSNAKIEIDASPGSLLGGPFCTGQACGGCRQVRAGEIGELHLLFLREAYRRDPAVRAELDRLAGHHRYGRNHIAVFTLDEAVGQNVIRAIEGLAGRLPYLEMFEA